MVNNKRVDETGGRSLSSRKYMREMQYPDYETILLATDSMRIELAAKKLETQAKLARLGNFSQCLNFTSEGSWRHL